MAYARRRDSRVPRSIVLSLPQGGGSGSRGTGQKGAATTDCREFIDAANRVGPNPQVIEKDLVLGCVLAGAYDQEGLRPEAPAKTSPS